MDSTQTPTKRLSLADFSMKNSQQQFQDSLESISGGILGACHCQTTSSTRTDCLLWGQLCVTTTTTTTVCK